MVRFLDRAEAQDGDLRFSQYLARFHIGGIVLLILVVVSSVLWLSARHNELARDSSERMVAGGIGAFKAKMQTVVKDYSIWDEAYDAVRADDFGWLYSNIGTGAAEIGALDKIVIVDPIRSRNFGWRADSPEQGERDLLPPEIIATMIRMLSGAGDSENASESVFELLNGEPWAFAITRIIPVGGLPEGTELADLPMQIHGLHVTKEVLDGIGANMLMDDLGISDSPCRTTASFPSSRARAPRSPMSTGCRRVPAPRFSGRSPCRSASRCWAWPRSPSSPPASPCGPPRASKRR
jgi:sensor domain CHASE-containing protein